MLTDKQYKTKYKNLRRKNIFKRALTLQNNFREMFLHQNDKAILNMLSQCAHYYYDQSTFII